MYNLLIENIDITKSKIIIENGLMDSLSKHLEDERCFLITNNKVAKLYPQILYKFHNDRIIIIKDGEKYKNFKTYNFIMEKLLELKIERKDTIVALGGGVVGDLAGYCASTILRGVQLVQIPTTLVAMCDSSIGGKTGYNTKNGKNLIGSFYKAKKILIDPLFLNTLNDYEIKCGFGEIAKYALIEKSCRNQEFFNLFEFLMRNQKDDIKNEMENIIKMCASLKAMVVNLDEKEGKLRKVLNFGHTFAHPIETLTNYKKVSHGKAVAYGIKFASQLAFNMGKINKEYLNEIESLLEKLELIQYELKFDKQKFIDLMYHDKKVENAKINLLLPSAPLEVELFDDITEPLLEACLP